MSKAVEWYRRECALLETRASGRVVPALLNPVRVSLPGTDGEGVPLDKVAAIGVRDGSTLWITAFDEHVEHFLQHRWP
jgi:ribosome recycling factor